MTSEEKVRRLFRKLCEDQSFFIRATYDEKYLYNLFSFEAMRYEIERVSKLKDADIDN